MAFGAQKPFISESAARSDENNLYSFGTVATNRWISFYMDLIGTMIVVSAAILSVVSKSLNISPSVVGLSVAYALQASFHFSNFNLNPCLLSAFTDLNLQYCTV